MRKYMCEKGRGIVQAEEKVHAMEKMECATCKHSIERFKDKPNIYHFLRFSDKVCHGPSLCASK